MITPNIIESHKENIRTVPLWARARAGYWSNIKRFKANYSIINQESSWIGFPFYHNVFADQRNEFCEQLRFMRSVGEFISLDDAVELLESGAKIDGRYFCLTFDDGIEGCYENAYPILKEHDISGAFFIMPEYMSEGKGRSRRACREIAGMKNWVRYFTWDECLEMANGGMVIGSHTCSHARLSELSEDSVGKELLRSKEIIEGRLNRKCNHFACPWGRPGIDFIPLKHEIIAKQMGYRSFLVVQRGAMKQGDSPLFIRRDYFDASDKPYMLRYYFSR
jgi:peptidoglycan/xylan/chitin deacetylase (PgdA/CDA1 family)